jgi:hypothetical protein
MNGTMATEAMRRTAPVPVVLLREPGGDPLSCFDGAFLAERQTH